MKYYNNKGMMIIMLVVFLFGALTIFYIFGGRQKVIAEKTEAQIQYNYENEVNNIRDLTGFAFKKEDVEKDMGEPHYESQYNGYDYYVYSMEDQSLRFIIFNKVNNVVEDVWNLEKDFDSKKLNKIIKDLSFDEIKKIDPFAKLEKIDENSAISKHISITGEGLEVEYYNNDNWIVNDLHYTKDASDITSRIIKNFFNEHY